MKYKLWGGLLCICALVLSLGAPLLAGGGQTRYHQHRDAPTKQADTADTGGLSTHLPLVEIDTGGVEIPGKPTYDENGVSHYTTAADGSEDILARMDIIDHETTYNHADDAPTLETAVRLHVRGRSSRHFDKSGYSLRLVNADGTNNPQSVLGMDAHHEWALHGPYLDKTLLRNYMWYNIGGEIMGYAPNVRFCEVILNGVYQGVYVMTEKLTAGDNGARLNLKVNAKDNTFSGYLLQLNGGEPSNGGHTRQFSFYTERTQAQLDIVYPGPEKLTSEMETAISRDFSAFEKALYSYDFDSDTMGYAAYIDVQSFVDYFLINELTCNYDAGRFSTYIGKDTSGKLRLYLWDMNSACDNFQEQAVNAQGFELQSRLWYAMLIKDEDFTDALIDRYWELRKTYFDPDYLTRYIDEIVSYLDGAVDRNFSVWGDTFADDTLLIPVSRNLHSYDEAIGQLKDFLTARIEWMDANIDTLRQYSANSRVKKFKENTN